MSIIIGLYDDLTTAQRVVSDLEGNGFAKRDMHLATYDKRAQHEASGGFFDSLSRLFSSEPKQVGDNQQDMVGQLNHWGVPEDEAQNYVDAMRRGSTLVLVNSPDDRAQEAKQIMDGYGQTDFEQRADTGMTGERTYRDVEQTGSRPMTDRETNFNQQGERRLTEEAEDLRVGKRQVQRGGVRVYKQVFEEPVEKTETVRDETVNVERRPVDRAASDADLDAAFQEQSFEVTETDEELITDKQAHVTGEVVVSKQVDEHPETVRDTVRHTEVRTDDLGAGQSRTARDFGAYDTDFRDNYDMLYANRGHDYSYYEPGYRYGYDLAGNDRYQGKRWSEIEPDARREWERTHPRSKWDEFKDSIRYAWERASGTGSDTDYGSGTGFKGQDTEGYGTGMGTNR